LSGEHNSPGKRRSVESRAAGASHVTCKRLLASSQGRPVDSAKLVSRPQDSAPAEAISCEAHFWGKTSTEEKDRLTNPSSSTASNDALLLPALPKKSCLQAAVSPKYLRSAGPVA
jgi:hypothetical protein